MAVDIGIGGADGLLFGPGADAALCWAPVPGCDTDAVVFDGG